MPYERRHFDLHLIHRWVMLHEIYTILGSLETDLLTHECTAPGISGRE